MKPTKICSSRTPTVQMYATIYDSYKERYYRDEAAGKLLSALRYKIGVSENAYNCDEGGWVNVDEILEDYHIFYGTNRRDNRQLLLGILAMEHDIASDKVRFQLLGAKFDFCGDTEVSREDMVTQLKAEGAMSDDDIDATIDRHQGWYKPWVIRATVKKRGTGFSMAHALATKLTRQVGHSLYAIYIEGHHAGGPEGLGCLWRPEAHQVRCHSSLVSW